MIGYFIITIILLVISDSRYIGQCDNTRCTPEFPLCSWSSKNFLIFEKVKENVKLSRSYYARTMSLLSYCSMCTEFYVRAGRDACGFGRVPARPVWIETLCRYVYTASPGRWYRHCDAPEVKQRTTQVFNEDVHHIVWPASCRQSRPSNIGRRWRKVQKTRSLLFLLHLHVLLKSLFKTALSQLLAVVKWSLLVRGSCGEEVIKVEGLLNWALNSMKKWWSDWVLAVYNDKQKKPLLWKEKVES